MLHTILPDIFPLTDPISLLTAIALTVFVSFLLQRFKFFNSAGIVFTVVLMGILVSNIGFVPTAAPMYDAISTYVIPISLVLMLISVDVRKIFKLPKGPLLAILIACASVTITALVVGLIFASHIDEGWKISGMLVGSYTGGSPNLVAIGQALDISSTGLAAANAADYIVCMPAMILLFALPNICRKSKRFQKFWPYSISESELAVDDGHKITSELNWSVIDISKLLGVSMSIYFVSHILAGFFPDFFVGPAEVLIITTISLCAGQSEKIRNLKGSMDLGMLLSLWFLAVIGYAVSLKQFFESALFIAIFAITLLIVTMVLHVLFCRLMKIPYQYVMTSIMAAIWDGPCAALLAISAEWKSLVAIAIVMGTIGHVMGNYLGVMVAYVLKAAFGI